MVTNMRLRFLFFFVIGFSLSGWSQTDSSVLRLLFTGDIMGHSPQIESAWNRDAGSYFYDSCFVFVKPIIESADLAIGNLELTFAGPPYTGYPRFSSPDALGLALKNAGFDVLCTANNHAADRGYEGLVRTLNVLDSLKLTYTGTFRSQAERDSVYPLLVEAKGIRLALLNYSYSTNGMPFPTPGIVNLIDTGLIRKDMERTKLLHPDLILAFMHWGEEYERFPSSVQKKLAGFLFHLGVDAIIGSHPHVVQPIEILTDTLDGFFQRPVFWSLGNFISNQRDRYRNGGIMALLEVRKDSAVHISSVEWTPVYVYRKPPGQGQRYFLLPPPPDTGSVETLPFVMEASERERMLEFFTDCREHLLGIPEAVYSQTSLPAAASGH